MHLFLGNEGTDENSSYDQMVAASTTCGVASDTSGYWVPSVVVDGLAVDPFKMNAYYGSGPGVDPSTVSAFPADLRIVAGGDTTAPGPKSAVWSCQGQGTRSLPVDCGSRKLRAHIKFPNCWTDRTWTARTTGLTSRTAPSAADVRPHTRCRCPR